MNTQLNIQNFDFTAFNQYLNEHDVLKCIQQDNFEFDPENQESFKEQIREYFFENNLLDQEIIYHANAIEFLKRHDQSLQQSLEIAKEYGYTIENIHSELLASLLKTSHAKEEFDDFLSSDTLQEIFNFLVLEQEKEKLKINHNN